MTSSSGRLSDVGDVGWYCLPGVRVNASERLCLLSVSQTPCSARNPTEEIESCGEKCANLCRVYKLIMVSRVPGYGHREYLVPRLSCESQHVTQKLILLGFV